MSENGKRRRWTATKKLRIVLAGLHGTIEISELSWPPMWSPCCGEEAMWSCTKHGDLANYIPDTLDELGEAVVDSLFSQYGDHSIKRSYFKTAKL